MLLEVLPDLLSKEDWGKAKAVVILIGSNDASFPETNPEQVGFRAQELAYLVVIGCAS